jgi:CHAT domain-containing protein
VGPAAREDSVRARLPRARVVHLAAHAVAYGAPGSRGGVVRGARAGRQRRRRAAHGGRPPGGLGAPLRAELVVLSACESGLGELRWTEGTLGLPRALLARGARSTLVSLWRVRDDATRLLMTAFYRHWLRDGDRPVPAEALRRAQADVRRVPGLEAPYFWAGFQVVGR